MGNSISTFKYVNNILTRKFTKNNAFGFERADHFWKMSGIDNDLLILCRSSLVVFHRFTTSSHGELL